ncbi:MAG: tyrosine-type recombinase/integrase [Oscillospiraceae bacterium]
MSVIARQVKNKRNTDGVSTGRAGTVYDVSIRYKTAEGYKTYGKRGFTTKQEALKHEAELKTKLTAPGYQPMDLVNSKQTVKDYLETWVEAHGKANLRPSTYASYKAYIRNHIVPAFGQVQLKQLTPAMIDALMQSIFDKGLSQSSARYVQRILSVALEHARKYHYIENNPARDIITRFGKQGKTPDPYTISQMQKLLSLVAGTAWEMPVMLGGLYGLRISEILGLRWSNVDMKAGVFHVVGQLPFNMPAGTTTVTEMAPLKSDERDLSITDVARPYFERQMALQSRQKELAGLGGMEYYNNDLVVSKANGAPCRRETVSNEYGQMLRRLELPHIRFHDLRHTAATNMHQLTGDFYTVGKILGHSLKGVGIQLGISTNLEATTAQYVDVRLDRIAIVLNTYHNAIQPAKDIQAEKSMKKRGHREQER